MPAAPLPPNEDDRLRGIYHRPPATCGWPYVPDGEAGRMLGKYADAVRRYERALALRPGWKEAEKNLAIARAKELARDLRGDR